MEKVRLIVTTGTHATDAAAWPDHAERTSSERQGRERTAQHVISSERHRIQLASDQGRRLTGPPPPT